MGKPAARVSDLHSCPLVDPGPKPHVGGPVLPAGASTVLVGGQPAARKGDKTLCAGAPAEDEIAQGSFTVLIEKKAAARATDKTKHGGAIVTGCQTVHIGNTAKILGSAAAHALFAQLSSQGHIPFDFPDDCCYSRAHEMCRIMQEEGVECSKVWNYGSGGPLNATLHVPTAKSGSVSWWYHVAPTVSVQDEAGTVQQMVMDPSIETGPVSVTDWVSHQNDPNSLVQYSGKDDYFRTPDGVTRETDSDYSKTNSRMAEHRAERDSRRTNP